MGTSRTDLEAIVRGALRRPDLALSDQTKAADVPGWDSFKMIEILMAIESRFAVVLQTQDIDSIDNFGDLYARVDDKLKARMRG